MGSNLTELSLRAVPLSRYGSHVSVVMNKNEFDIYNALERSQYPSFKLFFMHGINPVEVSVSSSPMGYAVSADAGTAAIFCVDDDCLVVESNGLDIHLHHQSKQGYGILQHDRFAKFYNVDSRRYGAVDLLQGTALLDGPVRRTEGKLRNHREWLAVECRDGAAEIRIRISKVETKWTPPDLDIEEQKRRLGAEWESYLTAMPPVPEKYRSMSELCWYTNWSCFIRANDAYQYDAMLMAKYTMSSVWSWDHCFNALAISESHPSAAVEQLLLPFERQASSGVLPDMWNPNSELVWAVTKPPIHGWCLDKLLDRIRIDDAMTVKLIGHLQQWTDFWLTYRDFDGDGIPAYPFGCDSGWDNSALFFSGFFIESPDLSAFLVLQMRTLARLERMRECEEAAREWERRAEELLTKLIEHSWTGERFIAPQSGTHQFNEEPQSALAMMPLILGELLPQEIRRKVAKEFAETYITGRGVANNYEFVDGKKAPTGGIWASINYLFADGLRVSGFEKEARMVAEGFCSAVETEGGPHEGFPVDSGTYGVTGYTWTSSVYLLFVREYLS